MGMNITVFQPLASTTLAVTDTTARVALPVLPSGPVVSDIRIANAGSTDCFFAFGNSAVAALDDGTSVYLKAGAVELFRCADADTHLAAITASGTTTLYISRGEGA